MPKLSLTLLLLLGLWVWPAQAQDDPQADQETLFQVSTLGALLDGVYQGAMPFEDLSAYGDFGLGTFEAVDGELVAFDGEFYQVLADGMVQPVTPEMMTPFAAVTFFEADQTLTFEDGLTCAQLYETLEGLFPSPNWLYALRVEGIFSTLTARSVAAQTEPYPPLADVVANQTVFELGQTEATLVGFWLPTYLTGINAVGFHLHGLTADKSAGGHILDCQIEAVTVQIDEMARFEMLLPANAAFLSTDLSQ
jgi:acetolactate decarboxylase